MDSDSGDDGHPSGTRFVLVDDLDTLAVALDTLINCEIIALDAEGVTHGIELYLGTTVVFWPALHACHGVVSRTS